MRRRQRQSKGEYRLQSVTFEAAGNAKPGSEVWKKLAAEVMANVLGQHYFSELWHNGQRVKFDNRPDG